MTLENRREERKSIAVYAFVSDLDESFEIKCVIRDASKKGCLLVSSEIGQLPAMVRITPQGFDKPICGKIVWKSGRKAGVKFVRDNRNPQQARVDALMSSPDCDQDDAFLLTQNMEPLSFEERMQKHIPVKKTA